MNADGQMQVHRVQVGDGPIGPAAEERQAGAVALLHRRLRGRYPVAIILAAIFASTGIVGGYLSSGPQYTSEALIRIFPTLPRVMYRTEENEMPPLFGEFVASQAEIIDSPRVLQQAADDPRLTEIGWPIGGDGASKLKRSIDVNYRRGTQIIFVSATTDSPRESERAVNAVIEAYMALYGDTSDSEVTEKVNLLRARRTDLESRLASIRGSILAFSDNYGSSDLESILAARTQELISIEQDIFTVKQRILGLETAEFGEPGAQTGEPDLSLEHLAKLDPTGLGELVRQREQLDAQIEEAQRFGPRHVQTRRLIEERDILNAQINKRLEIVRGWARDGSLTPTELAGRTGDLTLQQAQDLLARLEAARTTAFEEMQRISKAMSEIDAKREEAESVKGWLAETARALEQLLVETQNSTQGRIDPSLGDLPTQPSKDRRFQLAVLGGMAGAGFGVGIVLLFGLLKPSFRYLDEIEDAETLVPVLGTLPDLSSEAEDLESMATLSVHHLRNMLAMQARPRKQGGTAFMVTSARPGDGKTSLTVALGMSFAAQGVKVLLIDADLIGHGLSPTMRMDGKVGLRQVAGGVSMSECIVPSRIANLSVLPAGQSSRQGSNSNGKAAADGSLEAEHLSTERMHELIDEARSRFDIVLIDTGPLMGSLEANVLATVVDRVVLTVPRGQDPRLLRAALGRLRSIGANCAGLVFNRATPTDLRSSMSTISFHSQSMRSNGEAGLESTAESRHALVRAILMSGQPAENKKVADKA